MQVWDSVLYPPFIATIRGEYYATISRDELDEECFNLAVRAINTFKFPKISTEYTTFHAKWINDVLTETQDEDDVLHGRFTNDLTDAEIEVIIAWMKVYWCDLQLAKADNFEDLYTDANIKTYSRANAVDKNRALMNDYRAYAKDLETRYSRVNSSRKPALGDVNDD